MLLFQVIVEGAEPEFPGTHIPLQFHCVWIPPQTREPLIPSARRLVADARLHAAEYRAEVPLVDVVGVLQYHWEQFAPRLLAWRFAQDYHRHAGHAPPPVTRILDAPAALPYLFSARDAADLEATLRHWHRDPFSRLWDAVAALAKRAWDCRGHHAA